MNFSFIWKTSLQVQDILKDGEFSQWLLSSLDQKSFQELVFKAVKDRKRGLRWLHASRSDRLTETVFRQTKATRFETMITTVDEVNSDKTKVPEEFIFRSVLLDCFTAELDE